MTLWTEGGEDLKKNETEKQEHVIVGQMIGALTTRIGVLLAGMEKDQETLDMLSLATVTGMNSVSHFSKQNNA